MLPFKLVSADSHVLEPPDMWLKRIDRRFLEKAPPIVHEEDSDYFVCVSSETPKVGIGTSAEKKAEEISMTERWANVLPGGYDPFARIHDMERDGVEAEILYTTFGLFLFQSRISIFNLPVFRRLTTGWPITVPPAQSASLAWR